MMATSVSPMLYECHRCGTWNLVVWKHERKHIRWSMDAKSVSTSTMQIFQSRQRNRLDSFSAPSYEARGVRPPLRSDTTMDPFATWAVPYSAICGHAAVVTVEETVDIADPFQIIKGNVQRTVDCQSVTFKGQRAVKQNLHRVLEAAHQVGGDEAALALIKQEIEGLVIVSPYWNEAQRGV